MMSAHDNTTTDPGPRPPVKALSITIAVIGGIALLGTGTTAAFGASSQLFTGESYRDAISVEGVTELTIDAGATSVFVSFADVEKATLQTSGVRADSWILDRDEEELRLYERGTFFGGWFGIRSGHEQVVTLTLPESLNDGSLDAEINLGAGLADVDGRFGELDVEVGAGAASIRGEARALQAEVSAGRADLELKDVRTADLTVSAGALVGSFTGRAPDDLTLNASVGSLTLTIPEEKYAVRSDASAGDVDIRVPSDSQSSRVLRATASAGSIFVDVGR